MNYLKLYGITIVIFCLSLYACNTKLKKNNNTLVAHLISEPDDLHPTNGASAVRAEINNYIHFTLLKIDFKTGQLIPCIVKQLPQISPDGLTYSYELKNDVTWDNKKPVTAYDVDFTIKASKCLLTNNPGLKSYWQNIKSFNVDENTPSKFSITMKKNYILNSWFWTDFPIIQQSFYDSLNILSKYTYNQLTDSVFLKSHADINKWATTFNDPKYYSNINFISGGGAYKITKWEKGISLTLEKKQNNWTKNYQNYWFAQANADKIIFKLNNNNASTLLELKNNTLDVSTAVDFASFTELKNDTKFNQTHLVKLADTYNYLYIAINTKADGIKHQKILNDVLVRKALALLTPYEQINKTIYNNTSKRSVGPISFNKIDFNTDLKPLQFNIEAAIKLLTQAGWKDTDNDQVLDKIIDGKKIQLELDLNFLGAQKQWEDMAKQIAESMNKAKIFVKLNSLDYTNFLNALMTHDFDLSIGAWQSNAQPEDFSQLWSTASWQTNGLNFTGFGTPKTDALIDSINTSIDEPKRIALSKKFQKIVYDEQPYIFLFSQTRRVVVNKKWNNIEVYAESPGVLLNTLKLN